MLKEAKSPFGFQHPAKLSGGRWAVWDSGEDQGRDYAVKGPVAEGQGLAPGDDELNGDPSLSGTTAGPADHMGIRFDPHDHLCALVVGQVEACAGAQIQDRSYCIAGHKAAACPDSPQLLWQHIKIVEPREDWPLAPQAILSL